MNRLIPLTVLFFFKTALATVSFNLKFRRSLSLSCWNFGKNCIKPIQSSLDICEGLVLGPLADFKIQGCLNPFYKMAQYNWPSISMDMEPTDKNGQLYINIEKSNIFSMLSLPIHGHGVSLRLVRSSLNSFISDL